jgi:F-type H+-transporting ATPase subunit epsilon
MSSGKLRLTVVTPERAVLDGVACDEVTFPSERGELGILPGHTPLIGLLAIGVVTYRDGARKGSLAVRGGFAEIANDVVRLLADRATTGEAIDRAAVGREKEAAEAKRAAVSGDAELDAVNAELAFAEARLKLASG